MAIRDLNIARNANIDMGKIAWPYLLDPKYSDGTLPRMVWVGKGGVDNSVLGTRDQPLLTISAAIRYRTVSGRGDVVAIGPGSYAETIDLGATNYTKANIKLIGTGGAHGGITQIIGDGASAQPTIRVQSGYAKGFVLANVEVDTNGLAQPAIDITTNDSAASPTATAGDYRWKLSNVRVWSFNTTRPTAALGLHGATLGVVENSTFGGCTHGVVFVGSANNEPDSIEFVNTRFAGNTTADVTNANDLTSTGIVSLAAPTPNLTNIRFERVFFMDRGGTPVTNNINLNSTLTVTNVSFVEAFFGRAVTNGTNGIATLPAGVVVIGQGPTAAVNIVG